MRANTPTDTAGTETFCPKSGRSAIRQIVIAARLARVTKIAYFVSRFPVATETFIVRELVAVDERDDIEASLYALFPPVERFVHPLAEPWVERVSQPDVARGMLALAGWLARRPVRTLSSIAGIVRGYARRPKRLVRALATVPLAAAHARTLQRDGVRHVHAHWANYPAVAAWLSWRLTGVPYSITAHAHDIFIDQSNLRRLITDAAFVVTVSDYHRTFLSRYGGDAATPVHVVRYGLDVSRYPFRPRAVPASGTVRALCIGSFQEYKGHRHLLNALAVGGRRLERLELDLVGRGVLRPALERQAAELGLAHRLRFLGTVDEQAVIDLFARADLFVLPSVVAASGEMEGLPNALLEALASGVPAVGSSISGIPELLREDATCLLATPADPVSLAAALEHVLDDGAAARRRAEAGRRLVESTYSLDTTADRMGDLIVASARS